MTGSEDRGRQTVDMCSCISVGFEYPCIVLPKMNSVTVCTGVSGRQLFNGGPSASLVHRVKNPRASAFPRPRLPLRTILFVICNTFSYSLFSSIYSSLCFEVLKQEARLPRHSIVTNGAGDVNLLAAIRQVVALLGALLDLDDNDPLEAG